MTDQVADQVTQDAIALLLAMLNEEDPGAFNTILASYRLGGDSRTLVVTLAAYALQLGREEKRTDDELRGSLSAFAIEVQTLRDLRLQRDGHGIGHATQTRRSGGAVAHLSAQPPALVFPRTPTLRIQSSSVPPK
jgi:hypothetical protein